LPTKEVGGIKTEEISAGGAQLNELNGKAEKWFSFVGLAARIFVVFFFVEFLRPGNDDVANATQPVPVKGNGARHKRWGKIRLQNSRRIAAQSTVESRKRATIGQHTGCDDMHLKK